MELLRRHRARQAEERLAAGEAWQDHGLAFPSEVGTPLDPGNFSHRFSPAVQAGRARALHPHELRHFGASLMLAQGTPLHLVSEVLGHTSIAIVKDVYAPDGRRSPLCCRGHVPCAVRAVRQPVAPSVAPTSGRSLILADTKRPSTLPFRLVEGFFLLYAPEGPRNPNLLIRRSVPHPLLPASPARWLVAGVHPVAAVGVVLGSGWGQRLAAWEIERSHHEGIFAAGKCLDQCPRVTVVYPP
ncbi:hypothetical protein M2302_003610 [Micromonospora sp. A200]|nr:hypothetical protein [Micromonospora sp. A200]